MFAQHLQYARDSLATGEVTRQDPRPLRSSQGGGGAGRVTVIRFTPAPKRLDAIPRPLFLSTTVAKCQGQSACMTCMKAEGRVNNKGGEFLEGKQM